MNYYDGVIVCPESPANSAWCAMDLAEVRTRC